MLGAVGGFEKFDDLVYDVIGEVGFVGDGDYGRITNWGITNYELRITN